MGPRRERERLLELTKTRLVRRPHHAEEVEHLEQRLDLMKSGEDGDAGGVVSIIVFSSALSTYSDDLKKCIPISILITK